MHEGNFWSTTKYYDGIFSLFTSCDIVLFLKKYGSFSIFLYNKKKENILKILIFKAIRMDGFYFSDSTIMSTY